MKIVDKSSVRYETFRKEALLLKELHHPCIPIIYDIEEDETHSYLVEEYLQGDSLDSLVKSQGPLARCTVLEYAIQICGVVNYLHSAGTEPILHLDLQPKNLLVCHEGIKLVDFGQADRLEKANLAKQRFGTVGFAAPELYDCSAELDQRTDIYAIGGLILYLATGKEPGGVSPAALGEMMWSREAGRIIAACLESKKEERYQSAGQLMEDLSHLIERPSSSLVVAVHGLESCIGATHISLALCSYLWKNGIPSLYEEHHFSNHIRQLMEALQCEVDSFGVFSAFGCRIKPYYGRQIGFKESSYPVRILDCGVLESESFTEKMGEAKKESPNVSILVAGGKWWNRPLSQELKKAMEKDGLILYNFSAPGVRIKRPPGGKDKALLRVPLFGDPFHPDSRAEEWLKFLWDEIEGCQAENKGRKKIKEGGVWAYAVISWKKIIGKTTRLLQKLRKRVPGWNEKKYQP